MLTRLELVDADNVRLREAVETEEAAIQAQKRQLERLRRDKVDMEAALEAEGEAVANKLGRRLDKAEAATR